MVNLDHVYFMKKCVEVSRKARESGNSPFGAILVDDNGKILLEQQNIEITESNCTGHAETTLMVAASKAFAKSFLWKCTLYTTAEPCAMCSGSIYWGNVGKVVYGISEKRLHEVNARDGKRLTFDLPCREVFSRGQKNIEVIGPLPEVEAEIVAVHEGFWD
jgi:tRNA(Arg) A34 adenosine deaminase TadA